MNEIDLLAELAEADGPAGHEQAVAGMLSRHLSDAGAEVRRTAVGNVIGVLPGQGPTVLLQAHMDEMNLAVRSITDDGFVMLGPGPRASGVSILAECLNRGARILTSEGHVDGIFARPTGHLRPAEGKSTGGAVSWQDVFVDLGLPSRAQVEAAGVHVGCPVLYRSSLQRVGGNVTSKAFDDRVGLALMIMVARRLHSGSAAGERTPGRIVLAGTVQEESGAIGASSLRADIGVVDAAVALEVGPAGDTPGLDAAAGEIRLGQGPVIVHQDASTAYDVPITSSLIATAESSGIAIQHAAFSSFGSDGMQMISHGIPTALLAVPTRYTHSPQETISPDDFGRTLDLLTAICTRPLSRTRGAHAAGRDERKE